MGQLTNLYVSQSYQGLLKLQNSTTGVTSTLQDVQDGLGNNIPMKVSTTQVIISGSFYGDGSNLTGITTSVPAGTVSGSQQIVDLGFATTSSLDTLSGSIAVTDLSQDNRLTSLEGITSSLQNQINQKLDTGSFNSYTSSINTKLNGLDIETGSLQNQINGLATTSSLTSLSSSIALTDLSQNNRLTSIEGVTGSFANTSSLNSYTLTSSFNAYTSSNDGKVNDLISKTGSYATTGSNTFIGTQTINGQLQVSDIVPSAGSDISIIASNVNLTGSLNVGGTITATSASFTYVNTVYETASVIYSSGSNQFGDASNDTQTLWGTVNLPSGPLVVTGSVTSTGGVSSTAFTNINGGSQDTTIATNGAVGIDIVSYMGLPIQLRSLNVNVTGSLNAPSITGSLQGTASYATNALSSSHAIFADTASFAQNVISSSYAVTSSISFDVVVYGKCNNPGGLTRGTVVRIVGADGNNPLFDSASWTDDFNSANTLGVLSENVASNGFANIVVQGKLIGINTSGFTAGDMMYLSSSGQYTTQSVPAPYHEVRLGQVLRVNQNQGSMYVNIDNGYELTELHDVDIQAPIVGDVLTYVSGSYGQWVNKTVDELGYLQTSSFNTYSGNTLNLINQKLDTGSFNTYTASMDARTGSYATTGSNRFNGNQTITGSLVVSGSSTIIGNSTISGSLIASGSHTIVGNLVMTGALLISSSAATDILLTGAMVITRPVGSTAAANLIVTSSAGAATINPNTIVSRNGSTTTGTLGTFSGFYISNTSIATGDEMGFSIQPGTYGISGGTGNVLYTNDPTDSYPAMINFQNKATWTDGRISLLRSTDITGSLIASGSSHRFIGALNNTGSLTQSGSVNLIGNTNVTGSLTVSGSATITGSVNGNVNNLTVTSNTASLNLNNGNFFVLALTGSQNIRIEPSNIKAGQTINIKLNTTGSGTVSFPTSVKQASGSAYIPSTGTTTDIITLISFDNTDLFLANVKNLI